MQQNLNDVSALFYVFVIYRPFISVYTACQNLFFEKIYLSHFSFFHLALDIVTRNQCHGCKAQYVRLLSEIAFSFDGHPETVKKRPSVQSIIVMDIIHY